MWEVPLVKCNEVSNVVECLLVSTTRMCTRWYGFNSYDSGCLPRPIFELVGNVDFGDGWSFLEWIGNELFFVSFVVAGVHHGNDKSMFFLEEINIVFVSVGVPLC